uniref:Putative lipopolysaccharide heptosyltransferase III n=1 Tax=Desulfobacca acetoxidans TaxID=60893 RepID=A0A7C3V179_9BACT
MSYNNILVIKLKQPGDVLVSTPVIGALKEAWPQSRVTYLVPRPAAEMVAGHPLLDEVLVADRRQESWRRAWRLLQNLRRANFDLVLELSGGDRGAFYTLATRAPERVGFERPGQPFWQRQGVFTRLLPRPPVRMHLVEQNLEAVRALGAEPRNPRLQFFWDAQVEARVLDRLKSFGLRPREFAILHPGAGWRFKCWTPAGYARVIEYVQEVRGLPVILTASRAPHEQELIQEIYAECRQTPISLAGQLSLKELGALIAKARFFFGVDSAPMHLAAAVNTPAVALFGPSGAVNWRPWGEGHLVIQKDLDCVPCGRDGCEGTKVSRCLTELTPEEVVAQLEIFLQARAGGSPL